MAVNQQPFWKKRGIAVSEPPSSVSTRRHAGSFATVRDRRKYWLLFIVFLLTSLLATIGLLAYNNPMPFGTPRFWLIAERRANAVIAMAVVAICQSIATIAFQTVTNNRIITPGIMGFQSLYVVIHTATVYFFGATGLLNARTFEMFIFQLVLMVGFSLVLFTWLLRGKNANMHTMLLVGIVIGGGLGSVSTFMQRMLTPSEFDVLTARLFGSVNNADPTYYSVAVPLVIGCAVVLFLMGRALNTVALGRDVCENLGVPYQRISITVLVLVSILTAISTALVGPMIFLGFLVAMLTYQFASTYDHRYLFPLSVLLAFTVLTSAYFLMYHVFNAQGVVSIIIELVGASVFLVVLLRKGKL